jgi:xylan 1,4-beta-xylosidase
MRGASAQSLRPRPTRAKLLLLGNFADPTILREPDGYYLTHSSFDFHPGLLIWHSPDLKTWTPVTRAVTNQPGSIWAPELIRHGDTCYLYYPAAGENWVITARSPRGPWSAPQAIGVKHIDPGHVAGPDGKRYIHLSGGNAVEMSPDGLRAITPPKRVYEGWPVPQDWAVECFCLESPKFVVRDGWYYLTSAQGGTLGPSTSHMVVAARSRTPLGPWENSPYNPIIRTWSREEEWWSKGHGTIFEGPGGQWYCVLHGVKNGFRTLGRPTLIEPIVWTPDGWYRVADEWPKGWEQPVEARMPMSDDFRSSALGIQWQFHGLLEPDRFQIGGGRLQLRGRGANPGESRPLTVLPMHPAYEVEVEAAVRGPATAGLLLFASPTDYIGYALDAAGSIRRFEKGHRRYARTDEPARTKPEIALRIVNDRQDVRFYYRDGDGWRILQPSMDVAAAGPLRPALVVFGEGEAEFRQFRYRSLVG